MDGPRLTEERLRYYLDTRQPEREGMCLALLPLLGPYTREQPRRPKGGPDGGRDIEALYQDRPDLEPVVVWGAVGFRNGGGLDAAARHEAAEKFKSDVDRAVGESPTLTAFVFFTNVDLTPAGKDELRAYAREKGHRFVDIFDFERLRHALDSRDGLLIREQYLGIPMPATEQAAFRLPMQRPPRPEHFTGREEEVTWLLAELQPGRQVTLCGLGGMGKTALASEAIWRLAPGGEPPERFPDGVLWHSFYGQPSAEMALDDLARAYGEEVKPNANAAALRALAGRRALMVLDGAEAADNLEAVLAVTGSCGVLLTTRRRGDAPAGWLDLMPLPQAEAVALLAAWGGAYVDDPAAAARVAALLGGLPLAVFLVGRYLATRGQWVGAYVQWLASTPLTALHFGERQHKSIPLLMAHSLAAVSEVARAALGVAGVLTLDVFDCEPVAAALDIPQAEADRTLGELVDYGLLLRLSDGYQVSHALTHTYARQEMGPPGETLARLGEHYAAFAEAQSRLGLPGYRAMESQRSHIVAVYVACLKAGQSHAVHRIASATIRHLDLGNALDLAHASGARYDEEIALGYQGVMFSIQGMAQRAIEYYEQALAISQEIGDRRGTGVWLGALSLEHRKLMNTTAAQTLWQQALSILEDIESPDAAAVLRWLAWMADI